MRRAKNQHEWGFMANAGSLGLGDLMVCSICGQWRMIGYNQGKPFKMSQRQFKSWHRDGKIDATETLGAE